MNRTQAIADSIHHYLEGRWLNTKVSDLHEDGEKKCYLVIETEENVSYMVTIEEL